MTLNQSWGYHGGDLNYKSPGEVVSTLARTVHRGGNLLLNIGPEADGSVPPESAAILRQVGRWMQVNGEAIYGSVPSALEWACYGVPTQRGQCTYLLQDKYLGPEFCIAGAGRTVKEVRLLATGQELAFRQDGDRVHISGLPRNPPDRVCPVVRITFDGEPAWVPFPA